MVMRDASSKEESEAGILIESGSGFPIFMSLGYGKRKGKVAEYGNLVLS